MIHPLDTWKYSDLTSAPVAWLWEPYLARGKLAVLDGDPGVGKTFFALDLAARLSRGGPLPDGKPLNRPHTTLLMIADDIPADTTRPRLEAAGAALNRVVAAFPSAPGFRLPEGIREFQDVIREHHADLVVLDPLACLVPEAVTGGYLAARKALAPLVQAADMLGCAMLLVRHLTKFGVARSIYRGLGGIGVAGTVSTGLLLARHPDDPDLRVLTQPKNKVGPPAPSLGFRLRPDDRGRGVVEWTGPVDLTADELCAAPPVPPGKRPRERAVEWLQTELANGPRQAVELIAAAAAAGFPLRTLMRAKKDFGAKSKRLDSEGPWSGSGRTHRLATKRPRVSPRRTQVSAPVNQPKGCRRHEHEPNGVRRVPGATTPTRLSGILASTRVPK